MKLWPRLPLAHAKALADEFATADLTELQDRDWRSAGALLYAPTGGVPVADATRRNLRAQLETIAVTSGYPYRASQSARRAFDQTTLRMLADFPIEHGEGLRAEMWAWVTVILAPHIVRWRWVDDHGVVKVERYAGTLFRNAFGRLWYQGKALDLGVDQEERWSVSDAIGADQAVSLLERPTLGANRRISLAVGRRWHALPAATRKEDLFRETMKALIVRATIQRLDVLDDEALEAAILETFAATRRRIGMC